MLSGCSTLSHPTCLPLYSYLCVFECENDVRVMVVGLGHIPRGSLISTTSRSGRYNWYQSIGCKSQDRILGLM
ncbi:hypothetical protein ACJIZ3_003678 [Penstemon smallii]|uniref:Uncharacterized protein n=1 Tax=Penstemon smallii TaxID=265156 RepID=A0ABD3UA97_9LAMI